MLILLALNLSLMSPQQQMCYLYPWLDRRRTAFYCDMFGQRSNYA